MGGKEGSGSGWKEEDGPALAPRVGGVAVVDCVGLNDADGAGGVF